MCGHSSHPPTPLCACAWLVCMLFTTWGGVGGGITKRKTKPHPFIRRVSLLLIGLNRRGFADFFWGQSEMGGNRNNKNISPAGVRHGKSPLVVVEVVGHTGRCTEHDGCLILLFFSLFCSCERFNYPIPTLLKTRTDRRRLHSKRIEFYRRKYVCCKCHKMYIWRIVN